MESILEQLATYIPDMVMQRPHDAPLPETIHSYGVVMFADISGFTELSQQYCCDTKSKKNRTDKLSTILNAYLSHIIQAILTEGGDILKFAGDALLAFWSCSRFSIRGMLNHVLHESLNIQHKFNNFETQDGVTLQMKIGIGIGDVEIHYIGNETNRAFDVTGEAIDDANIAQQHTQSGAVVVSKQAWDKCNQQRCIVKFVGPGYAQVTQMEKDRMTSPCATASALLANNDKLKKHSLLDSIELLKLTNRESLKPKERPKIGMNPWEEIYGNYPAITIDDSAISGGSGMIRVIGVGLNLRPKINELLHVLSPEAQKTLRSYIIPTVLYKIDRGYEINWHSELRNVSVLFINLNPGQPLDTNDTLQLLQISFEIMYPSLKKYNGTLNKVFTFDKGCTYLCIFGLPHVRNEDSTCSALRAARDIFNNLKCLQLKGDHSIGITTGIAFCGVVGHPQRHEYTVIGQKVNMAARMMTNFPGCITCDETTKSKSYMSADQFTLVTPVTLKGISNPESIYKFAPAPGKSESLHYLEWSIYTPIDAKDIIGRAREILFFEEEFKKISEDCDREPGAIFITGSGGIGKSKLLSVVKARATLMDIRVVSITGDLAQQNAPFFIIKLLMTKLLRLDTCKNAHEKEQLLLKHVTEPHSRELLPLLNDLLLLKFPPTVSTRSMVHFSERAKSLHMLLISIVHEEVSSKSYMFAIDDAHWIDSNSWPFLLDLALEPNIILVLATHPLCELPMASPAMKELLDHSSTQVLSLDGLGPESMVKLACQYLNVEFIPDELKDIVVMHGHGVPLWCKMLLDTMLGLKYIKLIDSEDHNLTIESREDTPAQKTLNIPKGIKLETIIIPDSLTEIILSRISHMSASQQMTLKCAAIAGTVFKRTLLEAIIPNCDPPTLHRNLNKLAKAGIIECALSAEKRTLRRDMEMRSDHNLTFNKHCPCINRHGTSSQANPYKHHTTHSSVDDCHTLKFVHNQFQETVYRLWTLEQRKKFHKVAAQFLEPQAQRCKNCGGGQFIAGGTKAHKKKSHPTPERVPSLQEMMKRDKAITDVEEEAVQDRFRSKIISATLLGSFSTNRSRRTDIGEADYRSNSSSSNTSYGTVLDTLLSYNSSYSIRTGVMESPVHDISSSRVINRNKTDVGEAEKSSNDTSNKRDIGAVTVQEISSSRIMSRNTSNRTDIGEATVQEISSSRIMSMTDKRVLDTPVNIHSVRTHVINDDESVEDESNSRIISRNTSNRTDATVPDAPPSSRADMTIQDISSNRSLVSRNTSNRTDIGIATVQDRSNSRVVSRNTSNRTDVGEATIQGSSSRIMSRNTSNRTDIGETTVQDSSRLLFSRRMVSEAEMISSSSVGSSEDGDTGIPREITIVDMGLIDSETDINTSKGTSKTAGPRILGRHIPSVMSEVTPIRNQLDQIFTNIVALGMNMNDCQCGEALTTIFPQLLRHWNAAGNTRKLLECLVETATAALSAKYNIEALALLLQVKEILQQNEEVEMANLDVGRLESLIGQALAQMHQVKEAIKHYRTGYMLLQSHMPGVLMGSTYHLVYQTIKQLLYFKRPASGPVSLHKKHLDRTRLMAHFMQAYRMKKRKMMSLMVGLKRLNTAQKAQDFYPHHLIDAYAAVILSLHTFKFRKFASYYFKTALSYCCRIEFDVEGFQAFMALLTAGINLYLCQGKITHSMLIGNAIYNLTKETHDVTMCLAAFPLIFYTVMTYFSYSKTNEILKEFSDIASGADDLRAKAMYQCCHFDALLELGIDWQSENKIVSAAEMCFSRNVFFDELERFFLVSCLALWNARKDNHAFASSFIAIAGDLQPERFETYLHVRAYSRYTECCLLMLHQFRSKKHEDNTKRALKKFKRGLKQYRVFEPRYHHFKAYYALLKEQPNKARHLLNRAFIEAIHQSCEYDRVWCIYSEREWFKNPRWDLPKAKDNTIMFTLQSSKTCLH